MVTAIKMGGKKKVAIMLIMTTPMVKEGVSYVAGDPCTFDDEKEAERFKERGYAREPVEAETQLMEAKAELKKTEVDAYKKGKAATAKAVKAGEARRIKRMNRHLKKTTKKAS
jgi:hypothetical protein